MQEVSITPEGIQKNLKSFKPLDALCEYIWNGFDASATTIHISLHKNQMELINMITVEDNGTGISYGELQYKFKPFNDSKKAENSNKNHTLPHGRQGIGRLTFFSFAQKARWETVYKDNKKNYQYYINMDKDSLNKYDDNGGKQPVETEQRTGTRVIFTQINTFTKEEIIQKIKETFFWFLELNRYRNYRIFVDDDEIQYEEFIQDRIEIDKSKFGLRHEYEINLVKWNKSLGNEFSRFYFIDSNYEEKYKEATKLNKKSDEFYHSVYLKSDYFNSFYFENSEIQGQENLFPNKNEDEFKNLMISINRFLIKYRREFLKEASNKYIERLIDSKVYPEFDNNDFLEIYKREELDHLVGTLYAAQPRIFTGLSDDNKKITIQLLKLVMDADNKENLFSILKQVVDLDEDEMAELADVLKYTSLNNITKVIKLLEDRQKVIQGLKELVFRTELSAYEVPHIQEVVENHYWLFGEQYNLITAAEPDFTAALKGLILQSTGKSEIINLEHEDRNKEMDIFMIRQDRNGNVTENVVVELKRPTVSLGEDQLSQVKKYMRVIKSDARFNMGNVKWTFYLVGNKFNKSGYLEGELEGHKNSGEQHLVHLQDKGLTKIYVLKWSEIFDDFSKRHEYLMDRLKLQEELWLREHNTADEVVREIKDNEATEKIAIIPKRAMKV